MASCTYAPHRDILPPTQVKLVEPVVIGPRLGITDATPGGRQLEFREPRVTGGLNVAVAPLQDAVQPPLHHSVPARPARRVLHIPLDAVPDPQGHRRRV